MATWSHGRARRQVMWIVVFLAALGYSLRYLLRDYVDFDIYLDAARELADGEMNIYRPRETSGAFAYPHFLLLPLAWAQAVLSPQLVKAVWAVALAGTTVWILRDLRRVLLHTRGLSAWQWALFGLLALRFISQNLHHGQLSLLTSAVLLRGVFEISRGRPARGGAWLGVATALKLTPGLFLLPLLLTKRWKSAIWMSGVALALIVLFPLGFMEPGAHLRHLSDFSRAIVFPRLGIEGDSTFVCGRSASIQGTLPYVLSEQPPHELGYQLTWFELSTAAAGMVQLLWTILLALVAAYAFLKPRSPREDRWVWQSAVTMMAIALFSPLTYPYHLAGILLPVGLLCQAAWPTSRRMLHIATVVLLAFSFTLRQRGLLGHEGWWLVHAAGLEHLALVALLLWLALGSARNRPVEE